MDPPDAATAATAFSKAARVRMVLGRRPASRACQASAPSPSAAAALPGWVAGTELNPTGDRPRASIIIDIVFAVYWPPQAPGPGQATASSSPSSAPDISPAACSPTAS